jgi:mRNA-degrading endonuclease toxin of MazEF toxin-antitoxin module
MRRGDIYLVSLNPAKGREQQGERPVLIVSNDKFNAVIGLPVIAPIATAGNFSRAQGFAVSLSGAGTNTTGVILCDQLRVLDLKSRQAKRVEDVPSFIMDEVLARIVPIFED